jgi:hypothetical protein
MLVNSVTLSAPSAFTDSFARSYLSVINDLNIGEHYYRPVSLMFLAAERRVFGTNPFGYRVVHAALHAVNGVLVYALLLLFLRRWRAGSNELAAGAGAVLFVVAPFSVDAVLFLADVGDGLVLASTITCILAGLSYCERGRLRHLFAVLAAGAVCVLSKESGVVLPALLALSSLVAGVPRRSRRLLLAVGVTSICAAAMLFARAHVIDESPMSAPVPTMAARAAEGLGLAGRYTVWPHPLALEEDVKGTFGSLWFAAGAALAVSIAAICVWQRRRRMVVLGAAWWGIALLPSLAAVAMTGIFSARYLYVPVAGAACLAAAAWSAARARRIGFAVIGFLFVVWTLFAVMRVVAWSDDLRLWSREVALHPDRPQSLIQYGLALSARGANKRAEPLFLRAGDLAASRHEIVLEAYARGNACRLMLFRDDRDAAIRQCEKALRAYPYHIEAWLTLGNLHATDGDWDKAYRSFEQAVKRSPNAFKALISLAMAAAELGRSEEAMRHLDRAEALAASDPKKLEYVLHQKHLVLDRIAAKKKE